MLKELDMDLVYEERFCDAHSRYLKDSREGKPLMQRMRAAEQFSLRQQSNSPTEKAKYIHATKYLEENFPDNHNESVVRHLNMMGKFIHAFRARYRLPNGK
jgi:hypothetical protein